MKINQIKKVVKEVTGFEKVWVRTGTGSMKGVIMIMTSCNDANRLLPFAQQLKVVLPTINHIGNYYAELPIVRGGE